MFGKRFQKELDMINNALENEQDEKNLIEYITPYVVSVVDQYIIDKNITDIKKDELIHAGWTHFHLALKKYKERTESMLQGKNDIFYFNSYFNWYIRQGILEYLKSIHK